MSDFSNTDDVIDVRDIITRVEELREERDTDAENRTPEEWATYYPDRSEELQTLENLLSELCGNGGDEQWEGDWYPITLVRDSYFEDYAQEFADDCGMVDNNARWPMNCIDWEKAARELQWDYSSVEYDGITYWYR